MTVADNSLMSLSLALGEVSPIIPVWLYDNLGMLGGMVLMMHLSKELHLTIRMISKVIIRDSYKLGAW